MNKVQIALSAGVPVLIWGPPGVGKTASVHALARRMGYHVEVVLASIREPADFLGLPVINGKQVRFSPPDWAVRLAQVERGILFLDELSTAPPAVQSALLRVVLERVVGDLTLPSGVRIIAAANPPDIAANGWELSPPLANRFAHLHYRFSPESFARQFPSYWGAPPAIEGIDPDRWAQMRALIAGYLRVKPAHALAVPQGESERGLAWPSPRSWDHASRMLAVADIDDPEDAIYIVGSCVGQAVAVEMIHWWRDADLPDPEAVLADPERYPIPARSDALYSISQACVQWVVQGDRITRPALYIPCWRLLRRVADMGYGDIASVAGGTLARVRSQSPSPIPRDLIQPFVRLFQLVEGGESL